jgi:hypothetical protein
MKHRKYTIEWGLIGVAILVAILSVIADYYSTGCNWFARSGAIAVLLAAIVEYRISSHIYDDIYRANAQQQHSGFATKPKKPKNRDILSFLTHTILILGTIIWGYGDLLWS